MDEYETKYPQPPVDKPAKGSISGVMARIEDALQLAYEVQEELRARIAPILCSEPPMEEPKMPVSTAPISSTTQEALIIILNRIEILIKETNKMIDLCDL